MTSKYKDIYDQIFQNIIKIMDINKINHKKICKFIMSDFEVALRNSIKKNFSDSILNGCYFHYVKII